MRRKLSEILNEGERSELSKRWNEAAATFDVIPEGEYVARTVGGKLDKSRGGNPRFTVTFEISEGPYEGKIGRAHV